MTLPCVKLVKVKKFNWNLSTKTIIMHRNIIFLLDSICFLKAHYKAWNISTQVVGSHCLGDPKIIGYCCNEKERAVFHSAQLPAASFT